MNHIKRHILYSARGKDAIIKALALSVFIKNIVVSSTITNFTLNKLHILTGLSYSALRKRIDTLRNLGYIEYVGKNKQHLVFKSITSSNNHKNITFDKCVFDSIKDIEKLLYILLVVKIQKQKDFVRHTIQTAYNPQKCTIEEIKKARRLCKSYGYDENYKEYGLSYKTIAKRLGVSIQKAFRIIEFAIQNKILEKKRNQKKWLRKGIGYAQKFCDLTNITFCTTDYAYKIYANTYTVL